LKLPSKSIIFFSFVAVILSACATTTRYYEGLNDFIKKDDYASALSYLEKSKQEAYGEKNALLYWMDKGYLLHLEGKYEESNIAFEKAKSLAQEFFTKSVTAEASTLLISDNMRPYYGEDFERALINVFSALNYIFLENPDEALVEARQVDHFLETLQVNYGYKNTYKEDAFARYLMGLIFEDKGEVNDAYVEYMKALDAYEQNAGIYGTPVPDMLPKDALRCALKLGIKDDAKELQKKWKLEAADGGRLPPSCGELVIIHYNGVAPNKIDSFFEISFGKAWLHVESVQTEGEEEEQVEQAKAIARNIFAEEQVRMAFPKYIRSPYQIDNFTCEVQDSTGSLKTAVKGVLAENIGAIAEKSLDDRIARIRIRTIARAAIKFALTQKIAQKVDENNNNRALTWLVKKSLSIASTATEMADKRGWRSLPDQIRIARAVATEGKHDIQLTFTDNIGRIVARRTLKDVLIKPGKRAYVAIRTAD
jgi:uncharacterized protein